MSADPQEEDVLMSEFDSVLNTPPLRPAIEEMVAIDLDADLAEIQKPMTPTPFTPENIEQLFTTSAVLKACDAKFEKKSECTSSPEAEERSHLATRLQRTGLYSYFLS